MVIDDYAYPVEQDSITLSQKRPEDALYSGSGFLWRRHEKGKENYVRNGGIVSQYFDKKYDGLAKNFYNFFKFSNLLKAKGLENLDSVGDSGCVIVANHKGSLDPIYISSALKCFDKKIRWISKKENFNSSDLLNIFMEIGQVIPLSDDRKLTDYSKQRIVEILNKKEALGIFPEGTRNKSNDLLKFHTGAIKICIDNNVPYIPIGLVGKPKPFMGKVVVNIGEPVYLDNLCVDYDSLKTASIHMREKIIELLNI